MTAYSIETSALPDGARVHSFRGREALARPYRFDVHVVVTEANDVDLAEAIGAKVKLVANVADGSPPMLWHGVVSAAKLIHQTNDFGVFRLTVVPPIALLALSRHSKLFTDLTIPEIIEKVLEGAGLWSDDYSLRLRGKYEKEAHVCQYQESDLDFIHRWIEAEGIYYFFEHQDDRVVMVFADAPSAHEPLGDGPVRYHPALGQDGSAGGHFARFTAEHDVSLAAVRLYDYDYANPNVDFTSRADVSASGVGEWNEHACRAFTPAAAARLAGIRKEEMACREIVHRAEGTALHQRAGYRMTLEGHPLSDLDAEYLVVDAEHAGYEGGAGADVDEMIGNDPSTYRVRLTAVPAKAPWRARRTTRWPRVWGFEMATIDGPADSEYAQIDDQGRYAVKFHFDEGDLKDGKASTYLRMQQPHGGGVEGFHFPLRKGTEVMLTFQGGDPDRPIIAAVLPNAHTPSPVTSANNTTNIIQTGGRNRIEMEDLDGSQRVTMFSPTKNTFLRMGAPNDDANVFLFTEGIGCIWIGGRCDWRTGGNKDETVEDAVTEIFTGPFVTTVLEGDTTEEYKAKKDETVVGALTEDYLAKMSVDVNGAATETYDSMETKVSGAREEILQAAVRQTYTGPHTMTVSGAVEEKFKAGYDLTVGGQFATRVMSSVAEEYGTFEQTTGSWMQVLKGMRFSLTVAATNEFIFGIKNENIVGMKSETIAGMSMGLVLALKIGIHGSVAFEVAAAEEQTFGAGMKQYGLWLKKKAIRMKNKGVRAVNAGIHLLTG